MPNVRAVAVDLGGVIFLPVTHDPWSWIGEQLGVSADTVRDVLWNSPDVEAANIGALSAEAYAERTAVRLDRPASVVLAALEKTYAGAANDTLVAYLRNLRPSTTVAALTNNWSFLDRLLARHDLHDLFDVIVNSADVGCCKPSPEIFRFLLERLRCDAGEVVFIDDLRANVDAAAALGFRTIHFQSTDSALAQLREQLGE